MSESDCWLDQIRWGDDGLVPAIVQQAETGKVLMFAWMSRESLALSQVSGYTVYWSRSRQKLWHKGEESGNRQKIVSISADCDADVLLLEIKQEGGISCHTGRESCFYRTLQKGTWKEILSVLKNPTEMYQ